jgi:hypothetical protein
VVSSCLLWLCALPLASLSLTLEDVEVDSAETGSCSVRCHGLALCLTSRGHERGSYSFIRWMPSASSSRSSYWRTAAL